MKEFLPLEFFSSPTVTSIGHLLLEKLLKVSSFFYSLYAFPTCPKIKFLFSKAQPGGPVLLWLLQVGVGVPRSVSGASLSYLGLTIMKQLSVFFTEMWVCVCIHIKVLDIQCFVFFLNLCRENVLQRLFKGRVPRILSPSSEPNLSFNAYR